MKRNIQLLFAAFLVCWTANAGFAREIGGYVADAESRFVSNVWNFIKEFNGTKYVNGVPWNYSQYYYAAPWHFTSSNNSYVDYMDFAYFSGHGSSHYIQTDQTPNTGVYFPNDLSTTNGWGDWDMEFIVFQSCSVVRTDLADWWTPWQRALKGVHQIIGYRTLSYSDNGISNNFAWKLRNNGCVWQSWFDAVNEERSWWYGSDYPGYASSLWYESTKYDRLSSSEYPDPYGYTGLWAWHQY